MSKLYFKNPVFHDGINITVRRGIKWDTLEKHNVVIIDTDNPLRDDGTDKVIAVVDVETKVFRFCDLQNADVAKEHDPECVTVSGLFPVMQNVYPGFDARELVTVVSFDYKAA